MNLALARPNMTARNRTDSAARAGGREDYAFLLLDGFMMMALASAIETLRLTNHVASREAFAWRLLSMTGDPVVNSAGLPTSVQGSVGAVQRGERLVVVGGSQHDLRQGFAKSLISRLSRAHAHGVALIGLCTGALALVEAGVIPASSCAVHWEYQEPLSERSDAFAGPAAAFTLGSVPTAAGGVATAELFLHLVSARFGSRIAQGVADSLLLPMVRQVGELQMASSMAHAGARTPALRAAIAAMEGASEEILPIQDIAVVAGISVRQLERLFGQHLRTTPGRYYSEMRLQRARRLLMMTELSVAEIACATGFGTASQLSRKFRDRFGQSPHRYRLIRDTQANTTPEDRANRQPSTYQHGDMQC